MTALTIAFRASPILAISVSASTGVAPGRVDSPPMSMKSAPSRSIARARSSASSREATFPPSENESGVRFNMPMTFMAADIRLLRGKRYFAR